MAIDDEANPNNGSGPTVTPVEINPAVTPTLVDAAIDPAPMPGQAAELID
jgi:hypothetical protein